jgi:TRAP-type C4-dicarboxylate transport system substrate-binding protein
MNLNSFRKLPKEVQDIIVEVGKLYEEESGKALNAAQARGLENLEKSGKAVIKKLPEETRVEWAKSLSEFPTRMAKEADKKGLQGTAVMRASLEELDQAGYKPPVRYEIK